MHCRAPGKRLAVALGALVIVASEAAATSPAELLAAVAANARFSTPTRADLRIERQRDAATTASTAVLLGRGHTLRVETRDGLRALVRPSKIVVRVGKRIVRAATGARLGETDLLLEDLVPVTPALLKVPQVSDEGPTGTVVTGAPAFPSTRALIVLTVDVDDHVVTRTKYYEKSISDLAAFRRDEEVVDVDGHMRPTRVTIERSRDGTATRVELAWRAAPEATPDVFTLGGLRTASPVRW
jgi:hypothetical protein